MKSYLYKDLYKLEGSHWWHISKRHHVANLISRFKNKKNPKILDVGCGTGKNLEAFSKIGLTWGIDNNNEALSFCKQRGLNNIKNGEAEKITFGDKSFDIITLLDVLEHTDDKKTLKEVDRVLREDGVLIITVPAYQWMWSKWDEVLHHKRRYHYGKLKNLLESEGFEINYWSYIYSFLIIPALIVRTIKSLLSKKEYSSDFKLYSPFVNKLLLFLSSIEKRLSFYFPIPFGLSIVVVAIKRK